MKELRENLSKIFLFLGGIFAIIVAALWIVSVLNASFGFLKDAPDALVITIEFILRWATLILVGVVGLGFTLKRNIIIRIIFYLLLAALIIIHFFPQVYDQLIKTVTSNKDAILLFF